MLAGENTTVGKNYLMRKPNRNVLLFTKAVIAGGVKIRKQDQFPLHAEYKPKAMATWVEKVESLVKTDDEIKIAASLWTTSLEITSMLTCNSAIANILTLRVLYVGPIYLETLLRKQLFLMDIK